MFDWTRLTSFQRLILVNILRPSLLMTSVDRFIEDNLGPEFITSVNLNSADGLRTIYQESSANIPIVFVMAPGPSPMPRNDPSQEVDHQH